MKQSEPCALLSTASDPRVVCVSMSNEQPATALNPQHEVPPTYLGWAIGVTAFCFLPFGLVAVYFGWRSAQATSGGNLPEAGRCSSLARRWLIAAMVVGVLIDLVIVASLGLLGAFPSAGSQ